MQRNRARRQININVREETIAVLYGLADELNLALGSVLERALVALEEGEE